MLDKIIEIISNVLKIDKSSIDINSDMKNLDNWDSLNHVHILMELCEGFSLELNSELISDLTSVRKIYQFIKERK